MKSFREYSKNASKIAEMQNEQGVYASNEENASSAEELAQKIANAYNGKSNAMVLQGILAEAEKSKRAGTLSNDELENFYQSFSPMLNGFQRKQLRGVVDRLKQI